MQSSCFRSALADLSKLDAVRLKIRSSGSKVCFDPLTISDGVRKYRVVVYLVVLGSDVNLGVDESKGVEVGAINGSGDEVMKPDNDGGVS